MFSIFRREMTTKTRARINAVENSPSWFGSTRFLGLLIGATGFLRLLVGSFRFARLHCPSWFMRWLVCWLFPFIGHLARLARFPGMPRLTRFTIQSFEQVCVQSLDII